jgi:hypothetical protein
VRLANNPFNREDFRSTPYFLLKIRMAMGIFNKNHLLTRQKSTSASVTTRFPAGKVIYRLCDIEAYENECLVSSTAEFRKHTKPSGQPAVQVGHGADLSSPGA